MSELAFFIDVCDADWLAGWIDRAGPVSLISVHINDCWICDVSPSAFRPDLRSMGFGDGKRGFRVHLHGYMSNGVNRVDVRLDGEQIYARNVVTLNAPPDHPGSPLNSIIRPMPGEQVRGDRTAIVARLKKPFGIVTCEIMGREGFPSEGQIVSPLAILREFDSEPDLFFGEIELPSTLERPNDLVLTLHDERELVAATVISVQPPQHEVAVGRHGQVTESTAIERRVYGPLIFAKGPCSNFPSPDEEEFQFELWEGQGQFEDLSETTGGKYYEVYPSETFTASKSFLSQLSVGTDLPEFQMLAKRLEWRSAAAYFCCLPDVTLFTSCGFTLFRDKYVWGDSRIPVSHLDPHYTKVPGMFHIDSRYHVAVPIHKRLELQSIPFILFMSSNYSHWLHNSVTAAWHAYHIFGDSVTFILPRVSSVMIDSLMLVGINRDSIIITDDAVCAFDSAVYPSFLNTHCNVFPSRRNLGAFRTIRNMASILGDDADSPRRIYISRRDGPVSSPRVLENDQEVSESLSKLGFVTVRLHKLSFLEQVRLFRRAEIIVGQVGAGLINMAFAPSGCLVIEICNETFHTNEFLWFAALNGHRFIRVMAKTRFARSDNDFAFHVNVKDVTSIIGAVEGY